MCFRVCYCVLDVFFFFKQKTAYEMRISDWSSDVCSSDLLAPWRGNRMTRTSWQKYLPPNCAPMPISRVICRIRCSHSRSRKAWPLIEPDVGSPSRYRVEASLTVFRLYSAEVPPITYRKSVV